MILKKWLGAIGRSDQSIVRILILGYLLLTVLCFFILLLPISQASDVALIDTFFMSMSIVSTTGLVSIDFSQEFTLFGQIFSLIFIQLGGIGYMALSSFIILRGFRNLPNISARLLRLEFQLPNKYPLLAFTYSIAAFTILIELVGAIILYFGFRNAGEDIPLWHAIFQSISAFCTAGFSTFGDSMMSFKSSSLITNTILVLSILGSIGFIVLFDFYNRLRKKRSKVTLTSKIILISTFSLISVITIAVYLSDPALLDQGWKGLQFAWFQVISAHTTVGFNNYDVGQISNPALFLMIFLMAIGSSPAGTGGGIKTTSITAAFAVVKSIFQRRSQVCFLDREIPSSKVNLAIASIIFYLFMWILASWLLLITDGDQHSFQAILFETSSALSTVGLSTGISGDLSDYGKLIIGLSMFIGRLGVLSIGFAIIAEINPYSKKLPVEDIAV